MALFTSHFNVAGLTVGSKTHFTHNLYINQKKVVLKGFVLKASKTDMDRINIQRICKKKINLTESAMC